MLAMWMIHTLHKWANWVEFEWRLIYQDESIPHKTMENGKRLSTFSMKFNAREIPTKNQQNNELYHLVNCLRVTGVENESKSKCYVEFIMWQQWDWLAHNERWWQNWNSYYSENEAQGKCIIFPIRINGTMTTEKYIKFMSQFRGKSCAKRKTYRKT